MSRSTVLALDEARLVAAWAEAPFPSRVVFQRELSSTQDVARNLAETGAGSGTLVIAGSQTAGRGRLGRSWYSAPDLGIYLSLLLRPRRSPRDLVWWTLAAAVAICDACRRHGGAVTLKWPNDLVFRGSKLGGVLAESRSVGDSVDYLILGVGLNLFHRPEDFPVDLEIPASALAQIVPPGGIDPTQIAIDSIHELARRFAELDRGGVAAIARAWEQRAPECRGQRVRVRQAESLGWIEGVSDGLDDEAGLRVRLDGGRMIRTRLVDSVRPSVPAEA